MATRSEDVVSQVLLLTVYANVRSIAEGDFPGAAEIGRRAIALAESTADRALYLMASGVQYPLFLLGALDESEAILDRAIELADGDPKLGDGIIACPLAYAYIFKGGIQLNRGRLEHGGALIERGMELAAEHDALETVGWGHLWMVFHAQFCGTPEASEAHARQALAFAERIGDAFSRAWSWDRVGGALCELGDWRGAIEAVERSRAIGSEHRTAADTMSWHLSTLGQAHLGLGDGARAVALLREAEQLTRRRGERTYAVTANVLLARVLLAVEGPAAHTEIRAALERARTLAEDVGVGVMMASIHREAAELARLSGDAEGHLHELREAHRGFIATGATGYARRIEAEWPELAVHGQRPA